MPCRVCCLHNSVPNGFQEPPVLAIPSATLPLNPNTSSTQELQNLTTTMTTKINFLPLEIRRKILKHLYPRGGFAPLDLDLPHVSWDTVARIDGTDMRACSETCQSLREAAQIVLADQARATNSDMRSWHKPWREMARAHEKYIIMTCRSLILNDRSTLWRL
jgi:hypothetical protein